MRIIRASDYRQERWRNGGGWTCSIAAGRLGPAAGDTASDVAGAWHWRLSVASIERDGPFSAFPGVDRVLVLIEGAGMRLRFAGGRDAALTPVCPRIDFAGEDAPDCALIDGPTRDFNLMWQRAHCHARLGALTLNGVADAARGSAAIVAAYLLSGALRIDGGDATAGDTVMFGNGDPVPQAVAVAAPGDALLVRIDPSRSPV